MSGELLFDKILEAMQEMGDVTIEYSANTPLNSSQLSPEVISVGRGPLKVSAKIGPLNPLQTRYYGEISWGCERKDYGLLNLLWFLWPFPRPLVVSHEELRERLEEAVSGLDKLWVGERWIYKLWKGKYAQQVGETYMAKEEEKYAVPLFDEVILSECTPENRHLF